MFQQGPQFNMSSISKAAPLSGVNGAYVNVTNSNYPGGFGSNETNLKYGLPSAATGPLGARASALVGGKNKNKNNYYKSFTNTNTNINRNRNRMKRGITKRGRGRGRGGGKSLHRTQRRTGGFLLRDSGKTKKNIGGRRRGSGKLAGGGQYHQYAGQIANTPSYSVGGFNTVNSKNIGMANPPPIRHHSSNTNCVDFYNKNTNHGSQFW